MAGVTQTNSFNTAAADGITTVFNFTFFAFSDGDIKVYSVLNDEETEITSGITINRNSSNIGGNVTFDTAPLAAVGDILIRREVAYTQTTEFADLTRYKETAIEEALNKIVLQIQQLNSNSGLALQYSETAGITDRTVETPVADASLVFEGTTGRVKAGATQTEIANAESNATAAAASASAAAGSASAASSSATAAAGSASAAAAALESAPFRDIKALTNSDSPYAVVQTDNGLFFAVDTSGGAVVINLDEIADLTLPFNIRVKKETADANTVTINCTGTDEFDDGTTSKQIVSVGGFDLIAEEDTSPDEWKTAGFGASAGQKTVDIFDEGVGFDEGVDNQITLSQDPGSENNVLLIFDRTVIPHDEFNVSGTTLTYTGEATFPTGTVKIVAIYGSTLSIGTPGDATVTFAKMASSAIASQAEAEAGTATNKLMTPERTKQAIDALSSPSGRLIGITTFTASGTWTKPAGCNAVRVYIKGGGGEGENSGGSTGNDGGDSSFGAHVSATGGEGGAAGSRTPGSGSNGDFNYDGEVGTDYSATTDESYGGASPSIGMLPGKRTVGFSGEAAEGYGNGGACFYSTIFGHVGGCGGGAAVKYITSGLGATETVTIGAGGTGHNGGDGSPGIVVVEEYS